MDRLKRERHERNRRARVLALAEQRGIRVQPHGVGWHLQGAGVDLVCSDLAVIDVDNDLQRCLEERPRWRA